MGEGDGTGKKGEQLRSRVCRTEFDLCLMPFKREL